MRNYLEIEASEVRSEELSEERREMMSIYTRWKG